MNDNNNNFILATKAQVNQALGHLFQKGHNLHLANGNNEIPIEAFRKSIDQLIKKNYIQNSQGYDQEAYDRLTQPQADLIHDQLGETIINMDVVPLNQLSVFETTVVELGPNINLNIPYVENEGLESPELIDELIVFREDLNINVDIDFHNNFLQDNLLSNEAITYLVNNATINSEIDCEYFNENSFFFQYGNNFPLENIDQVTKALENLGIDPSSFFNINQILIENVFCKFYDKLAVLGKGHVLMPSFNTKTGLYNNIMELYSNGNLTITDLDFCINNFIKFLSDPQVRHIYIDNLSQMTGFPHTASVSLLQYTSHFEVINKLIELGLWV